MKTIITNPPLGIYDNPKTNIAHSFYLTFLDTTTRFRNNFTNQDTYFPGRTYNLFGKKGDQLFPKLNLYDELNKELEKINNEKIETDLKRLELGLHSLEIVKDTDQKIIQGVSGDIKTLFENGYLFKEQNSWILNIEKINSRFNLEKIISGIKYSSSNIEKKFERFIKKNMFNIPISRDTKYAPKNPLGGENIGPLFVLANMWDHQYENSNFVMTGGNKTLLRYTFLRLLCRVALTGESGISEVIIWPRLNFENGIGDWNLDTLITDELTSDSLRIGLISSYSTKYEKVNTDKSKYEFGKKLLNLVKNLEKPLEGKIDSNIEIKDESYIRNMSNFNYNTAISNINKEFRKLSNKIVKLKNDNFWNELNKKEARIEYFKLLKKIEPMAPLTSRPILNKLIN